MAPKIIEIRLDRLALLRNVPAGMDWAVIGLHVCRLRKTNLPVEPPIEVFLISASPLIYRIADGRHRFVASLLAGRDTVAAIVVQDLTRDSTTC